MAEELEILWQRLKVTEEEEESISLGAECTRATVERGKKCVFMKVLSRKGLINGRGAAEKHQDALETK